MLRETRGLPRSGLMVLDCMFGIDSGDVPSREIYSRPADVQTYEMDY